MGLFRAQILSPRFLPHSAKHYTKHYIVSVEEASFVDSMYSLKDIGSKLRLKNLNLFFFFFSIGYVV